MKLNDQRQACGGRTVQHVNGVPVPAFAGLVAGSPFGCWFQNTRVLCQTQREGRWELVSATMQDATYRVEDLQGQNRLYANARIWVADLSGYRDSLGNEVPEFVPVELDDTTDQVAVAVKATNSLAVINPRTGEYTLIEPSGPDSWEPPDIDFTGGELFYRKGGIIRTWPYPNTFPFIPARSVRYADGYLLEWQEGRGVVLRPEDSTIGIIVIPSSEDAFGLDMATIAGGVRVVSSVRPGELPEDFRQYDVNTMAWTVNGQRRDLIDLAVLPEQKPPDTQPPDTKPPDVKPPDPPDTRPPDPPQPKPPQPVYSEYLMASATTLNASLLKPSTTFPDRFLYPVSGPPYLSIDKDGNESESMNDGGNEALIWDGKSPVAEVEPADPLRRRYAVNVNLNA